MVRSRPDLRLGDEVVDDDDCFDLAGVPAFPESHPEPFLSRVKVDVSCHKLREIKEFSYPNCGVHDQVGDIFEDVSDGSSDSVVSMSLDLYEELVNLLFFLHQFWVDELPV